MITETILKQGKGTLALTKGNSSNNKLGNGKLFKSIPP